MTLDEIINFQPKQVNRPVGSYTNRIVNNTKNSRLGTGAFSKVFDIKSDKRQGEVSKLGTTGYLDINNKTGRGVKIKQGGEVGDDGYLAYIKYIYDNNITNPYAPRIFSLKMYRDKDGQIFYNTQIEKLIEFYDPKLEDNLELIQHIYQNTFGSRYISARPLKWLKDEIIDYIINNADRPIDKNLIEIAKIIRKIKQEYDLDYDLHEGNLMWRRTSIGLQLVITDPLVKKK